MTSKNSFFKYIKHNIQSRTWAVSLTFVVLLLAMPVITAGMCSSIKSYSEGSLRNLNNYFMNDAMLPGCNIYMLIAMVVLAIILGISEFHYLNIKNQVDLYHSIPVSAGKRFFVRYISGIIIYEVPYIINALLLAAVAGVYGCVNPQFIEIFIKSLFANSFYFIGGYTLVCLATILSGNLLSNILMSLLLLFGELLFEGVKTSFCSSFLVNYLADDLVRIRLSPVVDCMARRFLSDSDTYFSEMLTGKNNFWISVVVTIAAAVLAYFLYKNRKSENTGMAIAFKGLEYPVKAYITVLSTLFSSAMCLDMFTTGSMSWFIAGGVIVFVISHIVGETIFRSDFRQCFKHLWHWLADAVMVVAFVLAFVFDISGYDRYLPDKEAIEYVAIYAPSVSHYGDYYEIKENADGLDTNYINDMDYIFDNQKLTDIDKSYPLLKYLVDSTDRDECWKNENGYMIEDDIYEMDTDQYISVLENIKKTDNTKESQLFDCINVKYTLKNGSVKYRSYRADMLDQEIIKAYGNIYDSAEYKDIFAIVEQKAIDDHIDKIDYGYIGGSTSKRVSREDGIKIIEAYREELLATSFEETHSRKMIGTINLTYSFESGGDYPLNLYNYGLPLFEGFDKTMEALENAGFMIMRDIDNIELDRIVVSGWYLNTDDYSYPEITYDNNDNNQLNEIFESARMYEYMYDYDNMGILSADIYYHNKKTGERINAYCSLENHEIPQFVIDDMIDLLKSED